MWTVGASFFLPSPPQWRDMDSVPGSQLRVIRYLGLAGNAAENQDILNHDSGTYCPYLFFPPDGQGKKRKLGS